MFEKNQIFYMSFQCTDVYGCPKLLDMLGVYVSSDFKPGIHCSSIAAKAYSRCSLLLKGFHTSDVSILLRVFKTYVRPLLEFNTPVWNPWLFKDIEHIEGVQCYFTREIYKRARLPRMDYASRLANLNLSSLEYRRVYFDLMSRNYGHQCITRFKIVIKKFGFHHYTHQTL